MDKSLESIICMKIYYGLKDTLNGYIKVWIYKDCLFIKIVLDGESYTETFQNLSEDILNGTFSSNKAIQQFIESWEQYNKFKLRNKLYKPIV